MVVIKIVKLAKPKAPYEKLKIIGDHITIDTDGSNLILPTGNENVLPSFNEYVLNSNRLTLSESPFGGLKGSGSPDYCPGTLNVISGDGVYLQDVNGQNSTKTLTAGKLKELGYLTVDTVGHSITQEFVIANTAESNSPTVIDDCSSATGWSINSGSGTISTANGTIILTGTTDSSGNFSLQKTGLSLNLSSETFIKVRLKSSVAGNFVARIGGASNNRKTWNTSKITMQANTYSEVVLPILAPSGTTGRNPDTVLGTLNISNIPEIVFGVGSAQANTSAVLTIDNITADTAKTAYIELLEPNNLSATSTIVQCWGGSAYAECRRDSLDGAYANVSSTPANMKMLDGTKFDDVYGSGLGRAYFPKGASGETKAGSSGNITYSSNQGTRNRIGFRIDLPPSDGGRTNFNKVRLKVISYYADTVGNVVPDLSGNNNTGTIVGVVTKLNTGGLQFDGSTGYVDCGNPSVFSSITNKITASVRWKGGEMSSISRPGIVYKASGYETNGWGLIGYGTNLGRWFVDNTFVDSGNVGNTTVYNFYSMKLDGTNLTTYKNCIQVAYTPFTANITNSNTSLFIGKNSRRSTFVVGEVYEIIVHNRDLSADELTACMNGNPPSDGLIAHYKPTVQNMGSTTYEFADSTNASYGLQNLAFPWIGLVNNTTKDVEFYLFTERLKSLSIKRNESGKTYQLIIYPGNGNCHYGKINYNDLTRNTNADNIPDYLDQNIVGSLTSFLKQYTFAIH